jgi:hypothetical protein
MSDPVTPLEFLQAVYCNEGVALPVRMRAAIEAAPYVHPKLSIAANFNSGLGSRMEAMMSARGIAAVIDAKPREGEA